MHTQSQELKQICHTVEFEKLNQPIERFVGY